MSGVALKLLCWLDGFTSWSRRTCSWVTCRCHTTWYDEPLWQKKLDPTYSTTHAQTHARVVQRYWMRPLQSLPACLLHSKCVAMSWATACGNEGHIDTRMQRSSSCYVRFLAPAQTESVLTTQLRYEISLYSEDDSTSPTIMAIARTKGYTVKTDIFKVEQQISNKQPPMLVLGTLSLSTGTVLYSSCMDTTQQQPPPPHKGARPTRNWVTKCAPPIAAIGFFCLQQGPASMRAGSLISTRWQV